MELSKVLKHFLPPDFVLYWVRVSIYLKLIFFHLHIKVPLRSSLISSMVGLFLMMHLYFCVLISNSNIGPTCILVSPAKIQLPAGREPHPSYLYTCLALNVFLELKRKDVYN